MDREAAATKVFPGSLAVLRPVWEMLDEVLTGRGLSRDVKTIYVSYTDNAGHIVAATHPDPATSTLEVALSIDPDFESPRLYDAVHLKWRTLPRAVRLSSSDNLTGDVLALLDVAVEHAPSMLPRPTDDFMRQRRRGRFSLPE